MQPQALLEQINETARPSYFAELDELAATAADNGWTASSLAAAVNNTLTPGSGAGWVVVQLRKLVHKNQNEKTNKQKLATAGPCTIGCDYGWLPSDKNAAAVVPCPSCRPDTYRRVNERELARSRGASADQLTALMLDTQPMPKTYPAKRGL